MSTVPNRYKRLFIFITLLATAATLTAASDQEQPVATPVDEEGEAKKDDEELFEFKTPDMTEEEQHSQHMPVHMLCDGCKLIARMIAIQFEKKSRIKASRGQTILPESEIIEAVETVCENKFEDYGAKEVEGVLRLTGPHTDVENIPGVTSGGGKWPNRIRQLCSRYWDEIGDEEMYTAWRDQPNIFHQYLCFSPQHPRDACFKSSLENEPTGGAKERFTQDMKKEENARQERMAKLKEEQKKPKRRSEL